MDYFQLIVLLHCPFYVKVTLLHHSQLCRLIWCLGPYIQSIAQSAPRLQPSCNAALMAAASTAQLLLAGLQAVYHGFGVTVEPSQLTPISGAPVADAMADVLAEPSFTVSCCGALLCCVVLCCVVLCCVVLCCVVLCCVVLCCVVLCCVVLCCVVLFGQYAHVQDHIIA